MISINNKIIPNSLRKIFYRFFDSPKIYGWFGNYCTWDEAKVKCTGYEALNILEKVKASVLKVKNGDAVYERDSVAFSTLEYSQSLLDAFNTIAQQNNEILSCVDFGGSLGSIYFQYTQIFNKNYKIQWIVVEQKKFVDCGKQFIEERDLKFSYTIEDALKIIKPQTLLLASVLQYFESPYELIEKMLRYNFEYIVIDRTAFIRSEIERITVQVVPQSVYKASYAAWFLNERKFLQAFKNKYDIVSEFESEVSKAMKLEDNVEVYWKGFLLKRNN